jgi:CRISPR-associated endonuclease Cas1
MIIENPSEIKKENLRIFIKGFDYINNLPVNYHLDPKEIDELVLTQPCSISTEIYKLKPDLNILFFSKGDLIASIMPLDNLPKILKNEGLFSRISKYKRKKLMWAFCKAACTGRINAVSRLNETRKNPKVALILKEMRKLDKCLFHAKSRDELMGIEGNIAKRFYSCLCELNSDFGLSFKSRDRESKDIVNSLMNYAHAILRNQVKYRLFLNGISPNHSFLHGSDRNEEYLTFDFSEFWIPYVDKLIFYSIDKKIIMPNEINENGFIKEPAKVNIIKLLKSRITNEEIDNKIKEFIGFLKGENKFSWKVIK